MAATPQEVDFQSVADVPVQPSGRWGAPSSTNEPMPRSERRNGSVNAPRTAEGKLLTRKQIRARMRRKAKRGELLTEQEQKLMYKPIEDWDLEELAHGRPRNEKGHFGGRKPTWITREIHEKSMEMFRASIKTSMQGHTVTALDALKDILTNDEVDEKGKPIVPYSTKADVAKFLLEHTVGKPKQTIEGDISVKLQGILAQVVVNPEQASSEGYSIGHMPGITMAMGSADDIEDAELEDEDSDLDFSEG